MNTDSSEVYKHALVEKDGAGPRSLRFSARVFLRNATQQSKVLAITTPRLPCETNNQVASRGVVALRKNLQATPLSNTQTIDLDTCMVLPW